MADNTAPNVDEKETENAETQAAVISANTEVNIAADLEKSTPEEIDSSTEPSANCQNEVNKVAAASSSGDDDESEPVEATANVTDIDPSISNDIAITDCDPIAANSDSPAVDPQAQADAAGSLYSSKSLSCSPQPTLPIVESKLSSSLIVTKALDDASAQTTDKESGEAQVEAPTESEDVAENEIESKEEANDSPNSQEETPSAAPTAATSSTDSAAEVASTSGAEAASSDKSPLQSVYHIKWIYFNENMYPIVTQNENGPCPLLAIMNLLVLQGKIKMPPMIEIVTAGQLMEYLADCIFEHAPKDITEDARLNYEQNMHDAMAIFHKLQTGLDVNVKFTSVSTFEYTPECIVFDLLGIPLYHGWLVDPDSLSEVAAIGNCGYNQLVEKIITQKNSLREELVTEALIAEEFLNHSAAQLTYHGLGELSTTVNDGQLCVFFRNNHFSTLYKRKDELFILVTDQGFLTENNVVWETLSNVDGDDHFVDASFHTYRKSEPPTSGHSIPTSSIPVGSPQQVDQDYLVALSLQEEQSETPPTQTPAVKPTPPVEAFDSDHELAMRLQEEENRQANHRQQQMANQENLSQQHQQRVAQEAKEKKKEKSECVIL